MILLIIITIPGTMFSWQRSDGLDLPSDRSTFLAGNSTLIITDLISPDDIAEYECAVVEPDGGTTTLTYGVSIFGEAGRMGGWEAGRV